MNSTKVSFTAIMSFALGFFANEYFNNNREYYGDIFAHLKQERPATSSSPVIISTTANNLEDTGTLKAPVPATTNFSWERVNQMVALTNYDEGVRLLKDYMSSNGASAQAWFMLANIYQKQGRPVLAFDAWFHYLKLETDNGKIETALRSLKNYVASLYENPALFAEDFPWLSEQINALLNYNSNDSELHVTLASVYVKLGDDYQAQYHALMAVNDPATQKRAEDILAHLNGTLDGNKPKNEEIIVPLTRFGSQYLVNIDIEGNSARMLLDTGASLSGVSGAYVAKYPSLIKSTKPIKLNTAGGIYDSYLFTVDNLSLSSLVFNQHILAVLPMENGGMFDGLLGIDILGRFDFFIDQDAASLRLRPRKK